jgi:Ser/Thr protein kinase RdoA (MazF antagonist)
MDVSSLMEENKRLADQNDELRKLVSGYENVLKLNEKELENAESIIRMYENIVEFSRSELKDMTETAKAREEISQLSRAELMEALGKIKALENQNVGLKEQKAKGR